jgi:glycosyltransferase involved in cell wall biosynthesis
LRIAIVDPYIRGIFGQRECLKLAALLSEENEVDLVVHRISANVVQEVRSKIGRANLIFFSLNPSNDYEFPYTIKYMYGGIADRSLSSFLRGRSYDAIVVISSVEGWWLGYMLKNEKRGNRPLICLVPTDPPTGVSLEFYETGRHRGLARLTDEVFIRFQRFRLSHFDCVFGQSEWTNSIMRRVYGISPIGKAGGVDKERFDVRRVRLRDEEPYIAVPTVALDARRKDIVRKLHEAGVRMKLYGPVRLGIPGELGYISDEQLVDVLGNASATLFLFDYESLGLIPLESLSLGTPVITERRLGPGYELAGNEHVTFVDGFEEALRACRESASRRLTLEERLKISESVRQYSFENFARLIERTMEERLGD